MKSEEISKKIIEVASDFEGMFEIKSNSVWSDPIHSDELRLLLKKAGWKPGWAYCAAFVEAVWVKAYTDLGAPAHVINFIAKNMNPSVVSSFANFDGHGLIKKEPVPGAVMFLQKGSTPRGHAGLVTAYDSKAKVYDTIEGNTSARAITAEQDRNGDGIFKKKRNLRYDKREGKLNLIGFLHPIEW